MDPAAKLQILLSCISTSTPVAASRFQIGDGSEWDTLVDAADHHGLTPALYRAVRAAQFRDIPEDVKQRLHDNSCQCARSGLFITSQLLCLVAALNAAGVDVLPLKGPIVAETLYSDDPTARPLFDLDFMVRRADVSVTIKILSQCGYVLGRHWIGLSATEICAVQSAILLRHPSQITIDLQWEVGYPGFPFRLDPDELFRSRDVVQIAGHGLSVLKPERLLVYLCIHGTKHMWFRLCWLSDISRAVQAGNIDWDAAENFARQTNCFRPLLLGLWLAHKLLQTSVPTAFVDLARGDPFVQESAEAVISVLQQTPDREPSSFKLKRFAFRLSEPNWNRLGLLWALVKAPTEADIEWIRLPRSLFFIYYPIRIARICLKRSLF